MAPERRKFNRWRLEPLPSSLWATAMERLHRISLHFSCNELWLHFFPSVPLFQLGYRMQNDSGWRPRHRMMGNLDYYTSRELEQVIFICCLREACKNNKIHIVRFSVRPRKWEIFIAIQLTAESLCGRNSRQCTVERLPVDNSRMTSKESVEKLLMTLIFPILSNYDLLKRSLHKYS